MKEIIIKKEKKIKKRKKEKKKALASFNTFLQCHSQTATEETTEWHSA